MIDIDRVGVEKLLAMIRLWSRLGLIKEFSVQWGWEPRVDITVWPIDGYARVVSLGLWER